MLTCKGTCVHLWAYGGLRWGVGVLKPWQRFCMMSLFRDSFHGIAVTISMIRITTIAMMAMMIMAVVMMVMRSMRRCRTRSYSVAASCAGDRGSISAGCKHRVLHYCHGEQKAMGQRWRRSYGVSLSCNWDTTQRVMTWRFMGSYKCCYYR